MLILSLVPLNDWARACEPAERAKLVVVDVAPGARNGRPVGEEVAVDETPFYVGLTNQCGRKNNLPLFVDGTSRQHADLERRADGWWIRDAHSTNGTWVNGENIGHSWRKLSVGDRVAFGEIDDARVLPDGRRTGIAFRFEA